MINHLLDHLTDEKIRIYLNEALHFSNLYMDEFWSCQHEYIRKASSNPFIAYILIAYFKYCHQYIKDNKFIGLNDKETQAIKLFYGVMKNKYRFN